MRPELHTLIVEYQRKVSEACRLLRVRRQVDNPLGAWWDKKVPECGWLDEEQWIRFRFHGIGCRVTFGHVVVDFDFGPGGRHDGFDAWRLATFAATAPGFAQFEDVDKLEAELAALASEGSLAHLTIESGLGSHLYYFADANA